MQLLSAVPEQHFNYVVQTNLASFHSTDSSFQNRTLGLHQCSNCEHYQTWPALGYRIFFGSSSFYHSIEFVKAPETQTHEL